MNNTNIVWWILVPLFASVGLHLVWYMRRRKKMFERLAKSHRLRIRPENKEMLERILDRCFSSKGENVVRSFGQISSPIHDGSVWLFKGVELVDLNPHAQSYSTHFTRIAALFPVPESNEEWFSLDRSMRVIKKLPAAGAPDHEVVGKIRRIAESCHARHLLSVTLSGGYGLVYFEPMVTGGEKAEDLDSLYCIASEIQRKLHGG